MHAPFIGGMGMFAIPVVGTILVAVALAAHDRALAGKHARIFATAAISIALAVLVFGVIAAGVLSMTDETMLEHLREGANYFTPGGADSLHPGWSHARTGLVIVGFVCGAGLGGSLGLYVGSVMSLARLMR